MRPYLTRFRAAATLAALALLAGCAHKPPEPVVRDRLVERSATVEEIHMPSRMVMLRTDEGERTAVIVGPEVRNLEQVKVGDRVFVSYYEGIAAEVKKPGTGVQNVEETSAAVRAKPGERPAGAVGESLRTTVKIESVDTSKHTVTFRRQDGLIRTLAVRSPEGRQFIKGLRPGDEVEVTYTEALAVQVRPAH
jgi:hypothetical protein